MYTRSFPVAVSPRGLGEDEVTLNTGQPSYESLFRATRSSGRLARWLILRDVTTSTGARLIRGQLVNGVRAHLTREGRQSLAVYRSSDGAFMGWIPSRYARLRLEGLGELGAGRLGIDPRTGRRSTYMDTTDPSNTYPWVRYGFAATLPGVRQRMYGLGQGHEAAHSNVGRDGRSTGSIIESIGTAFRNVAEGTAAVVREGERASVARAGGSSDDAPPPDMSMYSSPTTTGFLSSTGGKVLIAGAVGLAILATILFLRRDKKEKNRRRNGKKRKARIAYVVVDPYGNPVHSTYDEQRAESIAARFGRGYSVQTWEHAINKFGVATRERLTNRRRRRSMGLMTGKIRYRNAA